MSDDEKRRAPADAGGSGAGEEAAAGSPGATEEGSGWDVRAVLLDMGGVVLDLGEARGLPWGELDRRGREALLELLAEEGETEVGDEELDAWLFDPWLREYRRRTRIGREARWEPHLARLRRLSGAEVPAMRLLEAWAGPYLEGLRPISGAQAALLRLREAELPLALISNVPMPGRFYRRVLEREGIAELFEVLLFSYDQGSRKPGPLLVRRALDALGIEPLRAVMVGDRCSTDIAAARAAGVPAVWIESPDADGAEPDAAIASLAELPALLGL